MTRDGLPSTPSALSAERLALALEAGHMGSWLWDVTSGHLEWDEPLERVFGLQPGTFGGTFEDYIALLDPRDREHSLAVIAASVQAKDEHYVEHRVLLPDGSTRWVSGRGRALLDETGELRAIVGIGADITHRKLAELRAEFLSRAGAVLGSSLDVETTLQQVSQLAIEDLADWCAIDLLEPSGVRLVTVTHRDPAKIAYARRLRERFGVDWEADRGLGAVLRSGQPDLIPEIDEQWLRETLAANPDLDEHDVAELVGLGLRASMTVPMVSSTGVVLGAISMVSAERGHTYGAEDLELATELARRAATAVDNAQLYARAAHAATTLQRSLLPPRLPAVPFADVAAFYSPSQSDELIGGDFYDLFPLPDGRWGLLLADVSGKGVDAAALTAACRWTLRSALSRGTGPADALSELNDTLLDDESERFVTVLAAVVQPQEGGATFSYASGGHPAPLVRRRDGSCETLPVQGRIVGLLEGAPATAFTAQLQPGDLVAVFSDGFTEARRGVELFGEAGMLNALRDWEGGTAAQAQEWLCAAVSAFGTQRDDMALVVLALPESA
ncbi:MAG: SpoIIE family protein phosphatase [Mycobacteriales bacterium]